MATHVDQPRRPAGRPDGGEWDRRDTAAAAVAELGPRGVDARALVREERFDQTNPDEWWATMADLAEMGPDADSSIAKLPLAWSGRGESSRRTRRIRYSGAALTVTMPSVTAIHRFAAEVGDDVFEVPVTIDQPGSSIAAWVQVRRDPSGRWRAHPRQVPQSWDRERISEAVSCLLEARHPRLALSEYRDVMVRARQRRAAEGAELAQVSSSWIDALGYESGSNTLVTATKGRVYGHLVSSHAWRRLTGGTRTGAEWNRVVKGSARVEVSECGQCGRYYRTELEHRCPVMFHRPAPETPERHGAWAKLRARMARYTG